MTRVIGNKKSIALEYELTHVAERMGSARFWLAGQPLGSLEDTVYLDGYVRGCLLDLRQKPALVKRYSGLDSATLLPALAQDLESFDEEEENDLSETARPYFLTCGTLFDCYTVFAHRTADDHIEIVWQLTTPEDEIPFSDLQGVSRGIQSARFSLLELEQLTCELEQALGLPTS